MICFLLSPIARNSRQNRLAKVVKKRNPTKESCILIIYHNFNQKVFNLRTLLCFLENFIFINIININISYNFA